MTDLSTERAPSRTAKVGILSLLAAVVLGALLSTVLTVMLAYSLVHFGKLRTTAISPKEPENSSQTRFLTLEPVLVNLSDPGGNAYLRLGLIIQIEDVREQSKDKTNNTELNKDQIAVLRDTVLSVAGQEASNDLLSTKGKDNLKGLIRAALIKRDPQIKLKDLYFTDFLVQK